MKRWIVLVPRVTSSGFPFQDAVKVEADYYKVDGGVLTFRTVVPCHYPEPVHTFAPGCWMEVFNDV